MEHPDKSGYFRFCPSGDTPVPKQILLLRHQSLPLAQIIKEMNIYSNNEIGKCSLSLWGAQSVQQLPLLLCPSRKFNWLMVLDWEW